jgi:hypothetical protein
MFFDCDGQLVTLEATFHVVSQIWSTDGGGFHCKAHVNVAGVEGTSPDETQYRFHDNGQSTFETDSASLNFEQDFVDRYRLTVRATRCPTTISWFARHSISRSRTAS